MLIVGVPMGLGIRNVRERQVDVSRVRVVQKLSYVDAVKKVKEDGSSGRDPERSVVSSIGFLAFIAMVINCTAGMERKLQKIEVVVAAAERYLDVRDLTSEELEGVLIGDVPSFQVVGLRKV